MSNPSARRSSLRERAGLATLRDHLRNQIMANVNLAAIGIGPVLTVNDIAASVAFYEKLGFTIEQRWEDAGTLVGAMLRSGEARVTVTQDDFAKGKDRQKGLGFRLWIVTDEDIDVLAAAVTEAGLAPSAVSPRDDEERFFTVTDPDGFKVSIAENG